MSILNHIIKTSVETIFKIKKSTPVTFLTRCCYAVYYVYEQTLWEPFIKPVETAYADKEDRDSKRVLGRH